MAVAAAVPRPQHDDFTGTTNTFTLEEEASLVRKTTYEEAWQKFREEESRVARSYQAASESGSMPSATMLGMSPAGGAYAPNDDDDDGDGDGNMAEEATRIVDPFLRASSRAGKDDAEGMPEQMQRMSSESSTNPVAVPPAPKMSPKPSPKPAQQLSPKPSSKPSGQLSQQPSPKPASKSSGLPLPQLSPQLSPQLVSKPLAQPSPGAYSMTSARVPGAAAAAVLDDVEGVPPETLELHGSQAMAMVEAVDAVVAAHEASMASMARPAAAELSSGIRVSAVPGGTSISRKGFPRWAVILFVVLLVGIILAGFFLGDDTSSRATPAATAGSAALAPGEQPSAKPTDPATQVAAQDPAAVVPGTEPAATPAAARPDAGPAATQTTDRVEDKPTRPRTAEKPRSATTRKARPKTKDRQKRRRDRNR